MNTTAISSAEPNVHFCPKPGIFSRPGNISRAVSFTSLTTKSRISIENPSGMSPRFRRGCRVQALYTPAEATGTETLYELLGIAGTGSTLSDIKKAYKQMARKYHPDVSPPERVEEHTKRFIMVQAAYETLSDPRRRALYDRDLSSRNSGFEFSARKSPNYNYYSYYQQKREENEMAVSD